MFSDRLAGLLIPMFPIMKTNPAKWRNENQVLDPTLSDRRSFYHDFARGAHVDN